MYVGVTGVPQWACAGQKTTFGGVSLLPPLLKSPVLSPSGVGCFARAFGCHAVLQAWKFIVRSQVLICKYVFLNVSLLHYCLVLILLLLAMMVVSYDY